ncbi:disulfide isomerase/thiol-disulfide oxidase [Pandoraea horticolens]|uniref:Thiol:disulfide interchange protein n=1 Tax=Pandoraea horticolens TaxID=2508298 RepID=A0A5E4VUS0_9BURK|nr:thiol:disulfide interchange protein DsbG [Pandoraea horticolens]VVE16148.1 disulfide isomerase/thiol-disulfide oxidase [Pandoraea horticolens]
MSVRRFLIPALIAVPALAAAVYGIVSSNAGTWGKSAASKDTPAVVQALAREGLAGLRPFDTGTELRGFAGTVDEQPVALYVLRDGTAIVGTRIDADGKPMDVERVSNLFAEPMSDAVWSKLAASTWVQDGEADAARVVYTFSDPNCRYCNRFWAAARPWVDSGKVQLRHVIVGVIKADSSTKAAAILGAPDRAAALLQNERQFASGGIAPAPSVSPDIAHTLDAHQQLMAELGFRGTPGIVYRDDEGLIQRVNGMPRPEALASVLGPR